MMQRDLTLGLLIAARGGAATRREVEGVRTSVRALAGASAQARVGQTLGAGARSASRELVTLDRATVRAGRSVEALTRRATEHARALRAARAETRRLSQDQQRLAETSERATHALTRRQRWAARVDTALTVGAGIAAGGYVATRPLTREMPYEQRLAYLAQTAYAGQSLDARRQGQATLAGAIQRAVREGGGTREGATAALDALVASGAMRIEEALAMLPALMRRASASGAEPADLAAIGVRGVQTFRLAPGQIGEALDMALASGWAGGFELRDMAKWLPQQMAAARQAGLSGEAGLVKLLAANQAAMTTAGTKDEAGNNLVNLLGKLTSPDTAKDFHKQGIDLAGTLTRLRAQGIDGLDAIVMLTDKVAARDKSFATLKRKTAAAAPGDKRALLEQQADILQGTAVGQVFQDRQALMALVALMNQREYVREVEAKARAGKGTAGEEAFQMIAGTAAFQAERLAQEKAFAEQGLFDRFKGELAGAAQAVADYAGAHPAATQAVTAAGTALAALAAGIGASGLVRMIAGSGGAAAAAAGRAAAAEAVKGGVVAAGGAATGVAARSGAAVMGAASIPAAIAAGAVAALATATAPANRNNPASAFYNPADATGDDAWTRRQKWIAANYSWWQRFKADSRFGAAEPQPGSEAAAAAARGVRGTPDEVYDQLRAATATLEKAVAAAKQPPNVSIDARATITVPIAVKTDADPEEVAAIARRELERAQAEQAKRIRGVIDDIPMAGP